MILPLLHSPTGDGSRSIAGDGIYLFGIWALLILVARQLAPGLESESPDPDDTPEG